MKGILFTTENLKAIRENRKHQTRRIESLAFLNNDPDFVEFVGMDNNLAVFHKLRNGRTSTEYLPRNLPTEIAGNDPNVLFYFKPRYHVGEVVYLKEPIDTSIIDHLWTVVVYPDGERRVRAYPTGTVVKPHYSKMFMPAWAARDFIKKTDILPQRLHDINTADIYAEGIRWDMGDTDTQVRHLFATLWDSINGKKAPFARNVWVFKYTFEWYGLRPKFEAVTPLEIEVEVNPSLPPTPTDPCPHSEGKS